MKTEVGQIHYYSLKPTVMLQNLVWPRYVDSVGFVKWIIIDGTSMQEIEIKTVKTGAGA